MNMPPLSSNFHGWLHAYFMKMQPCSSSPCKNTCKTIPQTKRDVTIIVVSGKLGHVSAPSTSVSTRKLRPIYIIQSMSTFPSKDDCLTLLLLISISVKTCSFSIFDTFCPVYSSSASVAKVSTGSLMVLTGSYSPSPESSSFSFSSSNALTALTKRSPKSCS